MTGQTEMFDPTTADALDLIAHLGDRVPPQHLWPQMLADLFAVHYAWNQRRGMDETAAALDARDRCILLAEYFGGRPLYMPTGEKLTIALRDLLIYRAFKGHNHLELAQQYDLTVTRIYQIVAEQVALDRAARQGKLFNGEGE